MGELSVSADYCNVHNSFVANFLAFDKPFLHREFLQMYAFFCPSFLTFLVFGIFSIEAECRGVDFFFSQIIHKLIYRVSFRKSN